MNSIEDIAEPLNKRPKTNLEENSLSQYGSNEIENQDFTSIPDKIVTYRYFTPYYKLNVQRHRDDICIRIHSNRIVMLSLAPSHIIYHENKRITLVNFKVSDKLDRSLNKVSGKSKHGAQPLQKHSNICEITCSDNEVYMVKCCINGKLVEINESLIQKPELLHCPPHKGGYLAIILPNLKFLDETKTSLLTQEQYKVSLLERGSEI
ncbi:protein Abitram isoform X2 [Prorops nasuta]|uniref:protein Abitram isoform X2 n=1 Tax=Prorops nasuta TaxID=863751 RepID=UPI0034CF6C16